MRSFKKLIFLVSFFWNVLGRADFPENNLHLEDEIYRTQSNMTEEKFRELIEYVQSVYAPLVAKHGARLMLSHNWESSTVNAYAGQRRNEWSVSLFGGMARRPELTEDGFALVICHEIGHHLAGFPFNGANEWGAAEGQADYFATQACAKRIFAGSGSKIFEYKRVQKCDSIYNSDEDRAICYRSTAAGESFAHLVATIELYPVPNIHTPSAREVPRTSTGHTEPQCRLDTYFSGALCVVGFPADVIPAKNHPKSQTSREAQTEAFKHSCSGDMPGSRPRCWFALR